VIDILGKSKVSTRAFNQFEKKYKVPSQEISTLVSARNSGFFPTSVKCLDNFPIIKRLISQSSLNMLEPTMGLGSMIDYAYNINPELDITGIEWNPMIFKITERLFPDKHIKLEHGDFLQKNFDNNEFDLILMNPPFSWGNDSRYFVDFIFKALNVMKKSTQKCNMILNNHLFFMFKAINLKLYRVSKRQYRQIMTIL
jgi:type I restriction-modification system DNA methylase subunit